MRRLLLSLALPACAASLPAPDHRAATGSCDAWPAFAGATVLRCEPEHLHLRMPDRAAADVADQALAALATEGWVAAADGGSVGGQRSVRLTRGEVTLALGAWPEAGAATLTIDRVAP